MMYGIQVLTVLLTFSYIRPTVAVSTTCSDPYIYVDIHLRNVDGNPTAFQYGLFMGLGTPSQNQSLWPSITNNETYVSTNDFCGAQTAASCNNNTHGHFGTEASTSWDETAGYHSADSESITSGMNVTTGTDDFHIFSHFFDPSPPTEYTIQNYTVNLLSDYEGSAQPFFDSGSLGLGPDSTMLNTLKQTGKIASRIVGLYLGTAYDRAGGAANGSIVLGGYDQSRIAGDVHEYNQVPSPAPGVSSLKINVKQVAIVLPDNTSIGLIPGEGFSAYLGTSQYELQFPTDIIQNLATAISASPTGGTSNSLTASKPFAGNLTITLDDGMVISFPPEWITNASNQTPFSATTLTAANATNATKTNTSPLIFGAAFLHHLYLTINHETSTFSLAEATVFNDFVQPQSLCPGEVPVAPAVIHQDSFVKSGLVGVVLGSVIGGIGLVFFIFYLLRKRLAWKRSEKAIKAMEAGSHGATIDGKPKKSNMKRSLRSKTRSFVRFATKEEILDLPKDGGNTEHTSTTHTDNKNDKHASTPVISITIMPSNDESSTPVSAHEMTSISRHHSNAPPSYTTNNDSEPTAGNSAYDSHSQIRTTTLSRPQYATSAMMTPMTAMTATPGTSNPLLAHYHSQFAHLDDADDGDLYLTVQELGAFMNPSTDNLNASQASSRGPSTEVQKRQTLGLTVNTGTSGSTPSSSSIGGSRIGRKKPMPLPLRAVGDSRRTRVRAVKQPALGDGVVEARRNPMKIFGGVKKSEKGGGSALRKMFPAS